MVCCSFAGDDITTFRDETLKEFGIAPPKTCEIHNEDTEQEMEESEAPEDKEEEAEEQERARKATATSTGSAGARDGGDVSESSMESRDEAVKPKRKAGPSLFPFRLGLTIRAGTRKWRNLQEVMDIIQNYPALDDKGRVDNTTKAFTLTPIRFEELDIVEQVFVFVCVVMC